MADSMPPSSKTEELEEGESMDLSQDEFPLTAAGQGSGNSSAVEDTSTSFSARGSMHSNGHRGSPALPEASPVPGRIADADRFRGSRSAKLHATYSRTRTSPPTFERTSVETKSYAEAILEADRRADRENVTTSNDETFKSSEEGFEGIAEQDSTRKRLFQEHAGEEQSVSRSYRTASMSEVIHAGGALPPQQPWKRSRSWDSRAPIVRNFTGATVPASIHDRAAHFHPPPVLATLTLPPLTPGGPPHHPSVVSGYPSPAPSGATSPSTVFGSGPGEGGPFRAATMPQATTSAFDASFGGAGAAAALPGTPTQHGHRLGMAQHPPPQTPPFGISPAHPFPAGPGPSPMMMSGAHHMQGKGPLFSSPSVSTPARVEAMPLHAQFSPSGYAFQQGPGVFGGVGPPPAGAGLPPGFASMYSGHASRENSSGFSFPAVDVLQEFRNRGISISVSGSSRISKLFKEYYSSQEKVAETVITRQAAEERAMAVICSKEIADLESSVARLSADYRLAASRADSLRREIEELEQGGGTDTPKELRSLPTTPR